MAIAFRLRPAEPVVGRLSHVVEAPVDPYDLPDVRASHEAWSAPCRSRAKDDAGARPSHSGEGGFRRA